MYVSNEFTKSINTIMDIPDEQLNDDTIQIIKDAVAGAFTKEIRAEFTKNCIKEWRDRGYTNADIRAEINGIRTEMWNLVEDMKPSPQKERLINEIFDIILQFYEDAYTASQAADIILPIMLKENAQVPTYAHGYEDAAADLYAAETVTLAPHSLSNKVATNVHIGLPFKWMAMIVPRSSIGAKTGLRLSNSMGVIDSSYRGPLGVLYDNISDSPYTINAGDRIAQLFIFPSYHFEAKVVDNLEDSERGEGGFGSTGK